MKRTIVYKPIELEYETQSGFDFPLEDEIIPDRKDDEEIGYDGQYAYGCPIKIGELKFYLDHLENAGAEWVSLEYHTDHGTYLLQGLNIEALEAEEEEKAEEPDIVNKAEIQDKLEEKYKLLAQLEAEIEDLEAKL